VFELPVTLLTKVRFKGPPEGAKEPIIMHEKELESMMFIEPQAEFPAATPVKDCGRVISSLEVGHTVQNICRL